MSAMRQSGLEAMGCLGRCWKTANGEAPGVRRLHSSGKKKTPFLYAVLVWGGKKPGYQGI